MNGVNEDNIKNIFSWFFVRDEHARTIVKESRRIKDIATIVQHEDAIENLIETRDIDQAFLYTNGNQVALAEAMKQARSRLKTVWEMLYKNKSYTTSDLEIAEIIFEDSKQIRNYIRTKLEDE